VVLSFAKIPNRKRQSNRNRRAAAIRISQAGNFQISNRADGGGICLIGHQYTLVWISITKRLLTGDRPAEYRLKFLQHLDKRAADDSWLNGEMIAALEPCAKGYEIVLEAQKLGPNKALDAYQILFDVCRAQSAADYGPENVAGISKRTSTSWLSGQKERVTAPRKRHGRKSDLPRPRRIVKKYGGARHWIRPMNWARPVSAARNAAPSRGVGWNRDEAEVMGPTPKRVERNGRWLM
jgi:hypothetical protein